MPSETVRRLLPAIACVLAGSFAAGARAGGDIYGYTDDAGVTVLSNVPDGGAYRLMLADPEQYRMRGKSNYRLPRSAADLPENAPFATEVAAAANAFDLDPALLNAVIAVESNHNPGARSPKGAMGLMQLMPDTSRRFGVADPWHPEQNIRGGARYLADLLVMFDNDLSLALAAYNAGEQAVMRYGRRIPPYPETRTYVTRVLAIYHRHSPATHTATPPARSRARQM